MLPSLSIASHSALALARLPILILYRITGAFHLQSLSSSTPKFVTYLYLLQGRTPLTQMPFQPLFLFFASQCLVTVFATCETHST